MNYRSLQRIADGDEARDAADLLRCANELDSCRGTSGEVESRAYAALVVLHRSTAKTYAEDSETVLAYLAEIEAVAARIRARIATTAVGGR